MTALLRVDGVSCVRGGRLLFKSLKVELGSGEALWVSGPNGAGKSSLLRLAAGLLAPIAGTVERTAPASLADEGLALDRELPLGRALDFWARLDGGADRLAGAMTAFGLDALADVPVRWLSTGQAKRARLARMLVSGAPLWLLDEPLNGLDQDGAASLDAAITAHRAGGGAVLAASHLPLAGDWLTLELKP